jgi:hypothetical protein
MQVHHREPDGQVKVFHQRKSLACIILRPYSYPMVSLLNICCEGYDIDFILGAVMIAGSNPNADYSVANLKYPTEYRMELFYPAYYTHRRPEPRGIPSQLSYGGPSFTVALTLDDLGGDITNIVKAKVILIRPGFSTHSMVRESSAY